jgi:hypothetical protein
VSYTGSWEPLVLLCAEILAISIRRSDEIKGFKFKTKELKLCQYADDTQILLDGSEKSVRNTVKLLENFSQISGLKVSYSKSELTPLGRSRMEIYTHNFSPGMKMTLDKIKVLGVTLPTNGKIEDLVKLNFEKKKQKIKDIVHSWSKRSLTLFGKVTIIKSLIIPQITYLLSILPNPEISYFKEIDKVIFSFLWDNKPPKLSRTMVLRKIAFGGAKCSRYICLQ